MNYVLEMMAMLGLYIVLYFILPSMMWKEYLKKKAYAYRFVFVSVVQTFIVINLILFLQLIHVCNGYTVTLSYVFLYFFVRYYKRWHLIKEMLASFGKNVQKLIFSTLGIKTFIGIYWHKAKKMFDENVASWYRMIKNNWLELIILTMILGYALWYYSYGVMHFNHYGFGDFTVHHSWVIDMKNGNLFPEGIYPMGMHCLLYFMDLYSALPLRNVNLYFGLFQTMTMLVILYVLVRSMCRSRFLPLLSVMVIACLHVFDMIPMARLQWTLPQEVGIYSVLACVYYLYRYLHTDIEKPNCKWYEIRPYFQRKYYCQSDLILFGISVALTVMIHFYDTMLAFAFCAGIAIMYAYRVFMKRYLFPLIFASVMALIISCTPLGIGLLQGKGIQASLTWATSVMSDDESVDGVVSGGVIVDDPGTGSSDTDTNKEEGAMTIQGGLSIMNKSLDQMIFSKPWSDLYRIACVLCFINGLLYLIRKDFLRFSQYLSLLLQGFLLVFLYDMDVLGLPMLVAQIRVFVFLILHFAMVVSLALDVCYHFSFPNGKRVIFLSFEALSLAGTLGAGYYIFDNGLDDKKLYQEFTIYNEAIACTDKINKESPEFKWTIISTINELTTTKEHGYHYELWELLRDVEAQKPLYIPTEKVYIYVEKKPMDYASWVSFDDLKIKQYSLSQEAAEKEISLYNQTDDVYKGASRVSIFSKTYVWAMNMMEMYPNEFKIYDESDNFVCFELTQNPFHLIDLSIPIDYSDRKVWAAYD